MKKFGAGTLTSGSKQGPQVTKKNQAVAIMLSEKKKAAAGNSDYKASDQPSLKALSS